MLTIFIDIFRNNIAKKEEYEITNLDNSYRYWTNMLLEKCMRIFNWENLPKKIPSKEIEIRLLLDGFCGYVNDGILGFMIASGGMSGVTCYWDEFTKFTYAAPTAHGGTVNIGKDCVIINNTQLRNSLYPMICRYASLLAHADVSLKCALINLRETNTYAASDENTAKSVNAYHKKMYNGAYDVIIDSSLINAVQNVANNQSGNSQVMDCIDARNELLRSFFNEIGVRYTRDKKERMITSEVDNDSQMLLINISDMLAQRQDACKKINKLFGTNISVELSKEFQIINNVESEVENETRTVSNIESDISAD